MYVCDTVHHEVPKVGVRESRRHTHLSTVRFSVRSLHCSDGVWRVDPSRSRP